jgi:lipopolysaccharide transport system permease protein
LIRSLLSPGASWQATRELAALLTRHWQLTYEMARREVSERYAGHMLGMFWSLGHPLVMMAVYIFIFQVVFSIRLPGGSGQPRDYTLYLLCGLIPWMTLAEAMTKSCSVIVFNGNLVKQVIFPVEVLPVKSVLASLLNQVIFTVLLLGFALVTQQGLPWSWVLLPGLLFLQVFLMVGLAYLFSSVGVFVRDLRDFAVILVAVGVYAAPIFYTVDMVPETLRFLIYLNPFTYVIECFHDVCYHGRIAHPWAWAVTAAMSLGAFYFGYRVFRKLKTLFGNVL